MTRPSDHAARWRHEVGARLAETAALREAAGLTRELWAAPRARRYGAVVGHALSTDGVLRRLLAERGQTYVDVGAGTGRYAIPLARRGRTVIAVEPSAGMRSVLERSSAPMTIIAEPWPQRVAAGDVVFAAHVLYLVPEIVPFLDAMTSAARHACVVVLAGVHSDAVLDPLWRHFHGAPRATNPTLLDVTAVLAARGQRPTLEVLPGSGGPRYQSVDDAIADFRESLALPRDGSTTRELRSVLAGWLIRRRGWLRMPGAPLPVAMIRWRPRTGRTPRSI